MSGTTAHGGPREDRRSKRTRHMLQSALVQLMMEMSYGEITVQDIIERANVGRSTFYSHYLDKDDLLQHEVEQVVAALAYHTDERRASQTLVPSLELLRHFRDSQALIRALTRGRAIEPVLKTMQSKLSLLVEGRLAERISQSTSPQIPLTLVAQYVAATLLMLAVWWLDRDMQETPEQIDDYFLQLVRPSVREVTGLEI